MTVGTIAFHTSTVATTTVVYTVPTGKRAEISISVSNADNLTKVVTLFLSKADTPLVSEVIQVETLDATSVGFERTSIVLTAGDRVVYTTTASNTAVVVRGIVTDVETSVISYSPPTISTNTTTTIFTAPTECTVNIGASITSSVSTDTANISMYISQTNIAGGVLFHKDLLTSYFTGFERTAVTLNAGDNIIMVTTDISGSIACRFHGFKVE